MGVKQEQSKRVRAPGMRMSFRYELSVWGLEAELTYIYYLDPSYIRN